ncbi:DUF1223 domain-containing protein [Pseudoflavitalea sp. G-6-1-2]|uniref:DUF1223 domain-containing protein n=1 Tax=Pseudoflavitalea sp. G-6-1-2 TaxID=2728841 RepID=UPI00146B558A|nr:DUF1223 domain-containing protein [Pseudoflavitalea sp. G-6-1-2]NML22319.1 DUF1223 domain-containing protein [Pseudoflavitalea sp. G-6-1-2]
MQIIKQLSKPIALASVFMYASCTMAQPSQPDMQPKPATGKPFAVVELFTSEGCSSCPPADLLIEELQQNNTDAPLYILSYHVDYWDHQGWKDTFSDRAYTIRQQQYASWLGLETIYTPQMIVNGQKEHVGSNAQASVQAINEALNKAADYSITLHATHNNHQIELHYQFDGDISGKNILLALVQKKGSSKVTAGENEGRMLPHVQIVRQLIQEEGKPEGRLRIKAPAGFSNADYELIAFVQNKKNGQIIAATKSMIN